MLFILLLLLKNLRKKRIYLNQKFNYFFKVNWKSIDIIIKILLVLINQSDFNEKKKYLAILMLMFYFFFLSIGIFLIDKKKFKFKLNIVFFILIIFAFYCFIWLIPENYGQSSLKIIVFSTNLISHFALILIIFIMFIQSTIKKPMETANKI